MTDQHDRISRRDQAVRAMLPLVASSGWTMQALEKAAGSQAVSLFPGGPAELVEAYIDMADRDMVAACAGIVAEQKLSRRVRTLIATRLQQGEPNKPAIRRALAVLATPARAGLASRCTARTVDAIWHAAGDNSADFSWYTKRGILGGRLYRHAAVLAGRRPHDRRGADLSGSPAGRGGPAWKTSGQVVGTARGLMARPAMATVF